MITRCQARVILQTPELPKRQVKYSPGTCRQVQYICQCANRRTNLAAAVPKLFVLPRNGLAAGCLFGSWHAGKPRGLSSLATAPYTLDHTKRMLFQPHDQEKYFLNYFLACEQQACSERMRHERWCSSVRKRPSRLRAQSLRPGPVNSSNTLQATS